jgi:hypothetical protein
MASLREPQLADLLFSELAAPLIPTVRPHILAAIEAHLPPLSDASARALDKALRDSEATPLVPSSAEQPLMERWLFAQSGSVRDEYALFVIENEVALTPAPTTLALSLERFAGNDDLRARAAKIYQARLAELQDGASWAAAVRFIEDSCGPTSNEPDVIALVS